MSNTSNVSYLIVIIMLCNTACVKHIAVKPDSARIPESDFVEVQLTSGLKYILQKVEVHEEYLEGEYQDERIRIDIAQIQFVKIINKDYGKVLTYYLVGFAVAVALGIWLRGLGELRFD